MRLRYKVDIRNNDEKRLTSLAWAALSVSEDVYEWLLLDAGHDDDELSRDSENSTILHLLASLPSPELTPESKRSNTKTQEEIYKAAVRMTNMYWDVFPDLIDWSNAAGKTPLHMACQSGNIELVRTLCELGADVQLTDLQGNSPLHYASAWNNLGCIQVLLSYNAPSSSRNNEAFTALDYAFSTTLAREFQLAIREANEERRARRSNPQSSTQSNDPRGGPYSSFFDRKLANKGSFMTVFSDDIGRKRVVGTSPHDMTISTPPMFHLTTPEPRSPSGSVLSSFTSERNRFGSTHRQTYQTMGTPQHSRQSRQSFSTFQRESSPLLSPTLAQSGGDSGGGASPDGSRRRIERTSSSRSVSTRSSLSEGRSRTTTSVTPNGSTNNEIHNTHTRPIVPTLYIPGITSQQRDRPKSSSNVYQQEGMGDSSSVFIDSGPSARSGGPPLLRTSQSSPPSPLPPPRMTITTTSGVDSLALGRPL